MTSRSTNSHFDMQVKLLMIGDSGVGKTCLLLRFSNDSFSPTFITTIGIDFKIKTVELGGKVIKLQIWDTAGQERFRTITTSYFRGAQGILLVYDVTDRGSFDNIANWVAQIGAHADSNISKVLIANKCDVDPSERAVSAEEGKKLAADFGIEHFFEASAKQNIQVTESFHAVANAVKDKVLAAGANMNTNRPGRPNPDLRLDEDAKTGGCACGK